MKTKSKTNNNNNIYKKEETNNFGPMSHMLAQVKDTTTTENVAITQSL